MEFLANRSPLLAALQRIQSIVERKNTVQVLGNILIEVKSNQVSLAATDLEVGIRVQFPVQVQQEGKLLLSAKQILDIVKELPDQQVRVQQVENNWVYILCGRTRFKIASLAANQYPNLPTFEERAYVECRPQVIAEMIDRTEFAAAEDATRYHINGIYFQKLENSMMRMVATDGHRLSLVDQEVFLKNPEMKKGAIIPKKGLLELRKLLGNEKSELGIAIEKGYLFANQEGIFLFVRLVDGEYPDYRPVIPQETPRSLGVNRLELSAALKRVSLLSNEKSRAVKLIVQPGTMIVASSTSQLGEAHDEIPIEYSGDPVEIAFNYKYLLEYLSVSKAEKLELKFRDALSPSILKESGQVGHLYVIMPMRI